MVSPSATERSIPRKTLTSPAKLANLRVTPARWIRGAPGEDEVMGWTSFCRLGLITAYGAVLLVVNAWSHAAMAAPVRILAFGDSLTAGWGLPAGQSFAEQLEKALRAEGLDVTVINAGVSGDTTAGGRARLDWALGDRPDVAIVELGANDGLRGLDPKQVYANLDAILTRLRAEKVRIVLAGMLVPPNFGRAYADSFRAVFSRLAAEHPVVFYPFFLDGVATDPTLNQGDGLHPNAKGVEEIVRRILPYVKKALP
ncbi:MAG: arylesterase [Magnetospirillum sp.]|nr:arylesterase [Magnetospirillum sp.]